jgi:hypothetical protein
MGSYEKGILGSFNGKVGTVVGATWKGKDYMRSKGKKSRKPFSEKQLKVHAKFILISVFVTALRTLIMKAFSSPSNITPLNSAFKYNRENAITGDYPAYAMDFSKVLVCRGELHNAGNCTATALPDKRIHFQWTDNSGVALAFPTDKSVTVAYCPELKRAVYKDGGQPRTAGEDWLDAAVFSGKIVETWLSFMNEDGTIAATSIYTGQVTIA